MRVRVRFAKAGKLRFISAIDLGRVWERALRKADLPIAYSEGFSPHPKISFGDALPLGFASRAEFAELTFGGDVDLADMTRRLNVAFPQGLTVLDAISSAEGDKRLGKLLQASLWTLEYTSAEGLGAAVDGLPRRGSLQVQRERKGEMVTVDLAPPLAGVAVADNEIRAIIHHPGFIPDSPGGGTAVRPDDLHSVLSLSDPPALVTRVAQGHFSQSPLGVTDALRDTTVPLGPGAMSALTAGPASAATNNHKEAT